MSPPKTKVVRFGIFEADLEQLVLSKGGLRIRLQEQPFQILALLLERQGEAVARQGAGRRCSCRRCAIRAGRL